MESAKSGREIERDFLSEFELWWHPVGACAWRVPPRIVREDHVVDRETQIEATIHVKPRDIVDAVGWGLLAVVGERPAVAHDRKWCIGRHTKELWGADAQEPMPLGKAVAATGRAKAIDHTFRDQQSIERRIGEDLVSI